MIDNFGNELHVGDQVIYVTTSAHCPRLNKGVITKVDKKPQYCWSRIDKEYINIKSLETNRTVTRFDNKSFSLGRRNASELIIKHKELFENLL